MATIGRKRFNLTGTLAAIPVALLIVVLPTPYAAQAASEGQLTWGVHTTLAPTWFDPAETSGIITPFMILYALHDALVKPMPSHAMASSLAESWTASKDGLTYEFVLRKNVKFHNGDVMTAEDVKFSFERYRGASAAALKAKVARIEIVDPYRIRFVLKHAWPDFMTFYATPPPARPGSCRRSTSRRSARKASRRPRSVQVRIASWPSSPVSSSYWKPSRAIGGRRPA